MGDFRLASELKKRAEEIAKADASNVAPKTGTSAKSLQFFVIAGAEAIKKVKAETEPEIKANSERLAKKYADEANAPIIARRDKQIEEIKKTVRDNVNGRIDKRLQQINYSRKIPIRESSMQLLQTIKMLIDLNAEIPESDWKLWNESFAGHYLEERVFLTLAKTREIPVIPAFDPEKSAERLESFKEMANRAIDNLHDPDNSLTALSFLNINPNSPLAKLMDDIDLDVASVIPAEKLTVLQRLREAEQKAYDRDDIKLSAKIKVFMERNADRLATPEEINEALMSEAENFIAQGMAAEKK